MWHFFKDASLDSSFWIWKTSLGAPHASATVIHPSVRLPLDILNLYWNPTLQETTKSGLHRMKREKHLASSIILPRDVLVGCVLIHNYFVWVQYNVLLICAKKNFLCAGVRSPSSEQIFFVAPALYLGDQRASYNHDLKFNLSIGDQTSYPSSSDLILEGAGTYVAIPIFGQENEYPGKQV